MKRRISLVFTMLVMAPLAVFAQGEVVEEVITVVGTKTERTLEQVGATISVIDNETIEQQIVRDISDLVRYEPGVSVAGTGSRFGLSGFNIRGIDGNRVLTLVDGVRVADQFDFGPFLDSRRDFVDVDSLQMVEIARGPISSLYGSDALGGVVSLTTKGPWSYVSDNDPFYADIKAGYSSDDSSGVGTFNLAAGNDTLAGLLTFTSRQAEETETAGSGGLATAREEADPQDIEVENIAAKVAWAPSEGHELLLSYESFELENDQQILSDYGLVLTGFGPPTIINTRDAFDERERQKLSLTYEYTGEGLVDGALVRVYQSSSKSEQHTDATRTTISGPRTRYRKSEFEQDIAGYYVQFTSEFEFSGGNHVLTYGAEQYQTDSESMRNGATFDLAGVPQFEFSPFPTRDFPITEVEQTAYFIQDEIIFLDGDLRVTPGLRYDDFEANVQPDAVYLSGNPGTLPPEDYDDSETTFSISVVYQFTDALSSFARYSEGFRAPPYDDVNIGFTNPLGGYKTISNPNLTSETSEGREIGVRWNTEALRLNFSVYQNDYEDFIESRAIAPAFLPFGGIDPADGFLTFQSINRAEVEIDGAELSGRISLGAINDTMQGFGLRFAVAYADGEDTQADEPLNTINPLTAVLGVEYDADNWGLQVVYTLVDGKQDSDIAGNRLATSGYGLVDVMGYYDFSENITLNVGLFNITDREYIRWADTVSIGSDAPARFTQPGFNAGATIKVSF